MSDYPVRPVPFTAVRFTDEFWTPRLELNRRETIPFAMRKNEETGRVGLFERAAAVLRGETPENLNPPGLTFDDTDIYKVIEGASYSLSVYSDSQLAGELDALIAKIGAAQESDGYLYTTRTINPAQPHEMAGTERWSREQDNSHELYNLGHLFEAAVAHYQATGKRTLLDIALRSAELLDQTFGPEKKAVWPGHQIIEMGLARLYRATGDERWIRLAKFFLDVRGGGEKYWQAHKPVLDQDEAVGHAVRAVYMYAGMADVAAMAGEPAYIAAIDALWENVVSKKIYITGGIGARHEGEAFGENYELPNLTAYCETCAAIGNCYWNHRLFLLHGDAKYLDIFERTLYNGLISGGSLDGKAFFYPNPLESRGAHSRSPWFGCACCPSNITRFMPSIPGYVYAKKGDSLYVNLFVSSEAHITLDYSQSIHIKQETRYPWDGAVRITFDPDQTNRFTLCIRVPGWARGQVVPSDLYRYADQNDEIPQLRVNGETVPLALQKGYVELNREWKAGDVVELILPMPVRRVAAHENVIDNKDRVALERGPIVFCSEWLDSPSGHVCNMVLPCDAPLESDYDPDLLGGIQVLKGTSLSLSYDAQGQIVEQEQEFTAIPYYAWANRGAGEMIVWLPVNGAVVKPFEEFLSHK